MNQLIKILGLSRSSIYRLRQRNDFIPAIRLGPRSIGYLEEAVYEWLKKRESGKSQE
ncbi:MAG: AlpA family phage regulatory protein [Burkholderiales bacterium]|nr:AlpA family phage regulatory protein [Burkholderiales bacterium]